jgi:glycosyltransferase involved in cell wall biosynthesis
LIYITIPVHNEERTIGVLLWKIRKVMAEFGRDYRILVLDDASTDGTADALARYRRLLPLTVTRSEERLGRGRATEKLLRQAARHTDYPKRDMAVTLQGDFTEDPAVLVDMVKSIEGGADLVAGVLDRSSVSRSIRWAHKGAGLLLGAVARGAPVSDPLSSLRAYRLIVVRKALREGEGDDTMLASDGWAANLELLVRTAPHARRVDEMPYRMRAGPRSRPSRFEPWRELRGLLPLRGLSWSAVVLVALLG